MASMFACRGTFWAGINNAIMPGRKTVLGQILKVPLSISFVALHYHMRRKGFVAQIEM